MNRRTFLIPAGLSSAGVALGSLVYRVGGIWWDQSPAGQYQRLSEQEAKIAGAIADALFPGDRRGMPNGREVGVVEAFDEYLGAIDEGTANLLKLLLHGIDEAAVPKGFSMRRFHRRPRGERIEILKGWENSRLEARSQAFFGLKLVFAMGYCESPEVIRAAGIDYECGGWQ